MSTKRLNDPAALGLGPGVSAGAAAASSSGVGGSGLSSSPATPTTAVTNGTPSALAVDSGAAWTTASIVVPNTTAPVGIAPAAAAVKPMLTSGIVLPAEHNVAYLRKPSSQPPAAVAPPSPSRVAAPNPAIAPLPAYISAANVSAHAAISSNNVNVLRPTMGKAAVTAASKRVTTNTAATSAASSELIGGGVAAAMTEGAESVAIKAEDAVTGAQSREDVDVDGGDASAMETTTQSASVTNGTHGGASDEAAEDGNDDESYAAEYLRRKLAKPRPRLFVRQLSGNTVVADKCSCTYSRYSFRLQENDAEGPRTRGRSRAAADRDLSAGADVDGALDDEEDDEAYQFNLAEAMVPDEIAPMRQNSATMQVLFNSPLQLQSNSALQFIERESVAYRSLTRLSNCLRSTSYEWKTNDVVATANPDTLRKAKDAVQEAIAATEDILAETLELRGQINRVLQQRSFLKTVLRQRQRRPARQSGRNKRNASSSGGAAASSSSSSTRRSYNDDRRNAA